MTSSRLKSVWVCVCVKWFGFTEILLLCGLLCCHVCKPNTICVTLCLLVVAVITVVWVGSGTLAVGAIKIGIMLRRALPPTGTKWILSWISPLLSCGAKCFQFGAHIIELNQLCFLLYFSNIFYLVFFLSKTSQSHNPQSLKQKHKDTWRLDRLCVMWPT